MPKLSLKSGSTSKLVQVFIQDSSSGVGAGLTGLVYNSAGLTAYYYREGANASVAISLGTMTLGTWTTSGFIVVDGTNMPGTYQLGLPDAALTAGVKSVVVMLKGATNMAPVVLEIELTAVDNQSATAFMTGVNALAPPTNWNLEVIDASGRVDVSKIAGTVQTARDIGASVLLSSGAGTGQLDFTAGVIKANLAQILGTALTETAGLLAAGFKQFFNIASPTSTMNLVTAVTTLTTYTGNTPQTGDSYARIGAAGAGLTALGDTRIANLDATVSSRSTYAGSDTAGTTTLLTRIPGVVQAQTGDSYARLGAPAGASISADVAAVKTDLDGGVILTSGYQATLVSAVWAAATRTLTSSGTVVADTATAVWAAGTRTLTAFGFTVTTDVSSTITTNLNATIASRSTYAGTDTSGTTTLLTRVPGVVQPQTGDSFALIGTAGVGLTNLGDTRIAHLDANISTRTKPADTQAAVTSLTNAPTAGDFTTAMKASLNASTPVTTLSSAYDPAKTAAQAGDAMALTSGERTTLVGLVWAAATRTLTSTGTLAADTATAVWGAVTRTLSAFSFTVNTTDTPPDNAGIAAIQAKTNHLPVNPAAVSDIPTSAQNADVLLARDWAVVSSPAAHSVLNALRGLGVCNRMVVNYDAGTITIYLEDGVTIHKVIPVTTQSDIKQTIVGVTP